MPAITLSLLAIRYVGMETRDTTPDAPGGSLFMKNFFEAGNSGAVAAFGTCVKRVQKAGIGRGMTAGVERSS
jgi:hypothetical protein